MDSDFFAGYNTDVESRREGHFGRRGPVIPFGKDKTSSIRVDSRPARSTIDYAASAIDFDNDPDTVDFKRVAGYRNLKRRR